MLAQNFKSPADLGLTDAQHAALCKTLVLMETGKLEYAPLNEDIGCIQREFTGHFNMATWNVKHSCGTVCCIGGTAELIGNLVYGSLHEHSLKLLKAQERGLYHLFHGYWGNKSLADITVPEAAQALRNYLTYGDARGQG